MPTSSAANHKLSSFQKAAIGALASVTASTLVYPLDLSKTLIQTQPKRKYDPKDKEAKKLLDDDLNYYRDTLDCIKKIYIKNNSIWSLYYGIVPSLLSTASMNFVYFFWYSIIKKVYHQLLYNYKRSHNGKINSVSIELLLGILAAAICQLVVTPITTISTKQQTTVSDDPSTCQKQNADIDIDTNKSTPKSKETVNNSFFKIANHIVKNDGITGLWSGLKVSLVLTLNPSITYSSYKKAKTLFFPKKKNLKPLQSLFLGMLAKLIATVITQPLIVSKAMIQKKEITVLLNEQKTDSNGNTVTIPKKKKFVFKNFQQCLSFLYASEGLKGLWKGIGPQLSKAVIVQGFLFMFKDQFELLFIKLLRLILFLRNKNKHKNIKV
ncbi:Ant1p [Ascoidea rubescens DSM 1968]|uniref:Mitochondrial carrier n=1 Tax=Ascoidea rubescens DSM 1968 TaxID=1344418 RepID=A0A1D2V9Z5_9ASCO|nr:mitochondrial carrier [Ascoidea rubescens DSM 1968]ODV58409.1 mitochondrial carrier [Ascoidea rubescens DSM 1968]